jgi:hypothetical protein
MLHVGGYGLQLQFCILILVRSSKRTEDLDMVKIKISSWQDDDLDFSILAAVPVSIIYKIDYKKIVFKIIYDPKLVVSDEGLVKL